MELNHLRYFYEVARSGSFTKASKTLRVSQPSISKIVKQFEDRQNVRLFDRGKRGVTLTDAGRTFFQSCQTIFGEIESLQSTIEHDRVECVGDLKVAASDNLCNYIFPALFSGFWKTYPRIRVKLFSGTSSSILTDLRENHSELGLFYTPIRDQRFETTVLAQVPYAVVCSAKNKLLAGKKFDPKRLEQAYYIGSRADDYAGPYPTLNMLSSIGVKPKLFFETNNQETQKRMVTQEYGFTVVPRYMVQGELKSGIFSEIKVPHPIGAELFFVKLKGRSFSRPAKLFEDHLKTQIKNLL